MVATMPILVPPDPEAPLAQGDVLKDIVLTITGVDGNPAVIGPGYALVISRNCNALRDERVVVAEIVHRSFEGDNLAKLVTLDDWRRFFSGVRDGRGLPDHFYLGDLDGDPNKRYVAKLDSLHTIEVPSEKNPKKRTAFIAKHRQYRLDPEYSRDLQIRIFAAFAPLGFDDQRCLSSPDLGLLILAGRADVSKAETELALAKQSLAREQAEGAKTEKIAGLQGNVSKLQTTLDKQTSALAPYIAEQKRRETS